MKVETKPKKSRFLLIFVCIFLAVLLIFGIVMASVIAYTNSKSAARYENVNISEGAARAFQSYYKSRYVAALIRSGVSFYEHESFWDSAADEGGSYGDYFRRALEQEIRNIAVRAALFDEVSELRANDKNKISIACEYILSDRAGGDERLFNEQTKPYGFTYRDMCEMATLVYKSERAISAIYGEDGSRVIYRTEDCEEYLSGYSHIYILFIRTEGTSGEDRAERESAIAELREAIARRDAGESGVINEIMFREYAERFSTDTPEGTAYGYYLKDGTAYTERSREEAPELTAAALSMAIGEFLEVEFDAGGVCFIYKAEPESGAYLNHSKTRGLEDFCAGAAAFVFSSDVELFSPDVQITDNYYRVDAVKIKYSGDYFPLT